MITGVVIIVASRIGLLEAACVPFMLPTLVYPSSGFMDRASRAENNPPYPHRPESSGKGLISTVYIE